MDTNKIRYQALNFVNNRPLCLISTLIGIKDFLLGLGFVLMIPEITRTFLFQNFDALVPGYSGPVAGAIFMIVAAVVIVTAVWDKIEVTRVFLRASAFLWLFSGIMYAADGNWVLAVALGFFMSVLSGYIAYYYKYAPLWRAQKRALREQFALDVTPAP